MARPWVWAIAGILLTIAPPSLGALAPGVYSLAYDMNQPYGWWIDDNEECQGRYLTHATAAGRVTLNAPAGDINPPLWRVEAVKGKPNQVTLMATGPGTPARKYLAYKRKACGDASVYLGPKTAWIFTPNQFANPGDRYGYGTLSPVDRDACDRTQAPLLLAPDTSRRPSWSRSCAPPYANVALALNSTTAAQAQRWLLMPHTGALPKSLYGDRSPWAVDKFGASVAAGAEDVVAAGEYGGAYVFYKKGVTWRRQALNVGGDEGFGRVVAAAKNYVAVARPGNTTAVLLYARPWATSSASAKLKPPAGASSTGFGTSIDMGDAFLAVGDPDAAPKARGAVYVSRLNGSKWEAFTPLPVPAGVTRFGTIVKVSGPTLAVTAASGNTTYIYAWDRTKGWGLQAQVQTPYVPTGVGFSGGTLVPVSRIGSTNSAQIFRLKGTKWVLDATITSPKCDAPVSCGFAAAALRDDNTVVLLRSEDPRENVPYYGGVYVRDLKSGKWIKKQTLSYVETGWDLWGRAAAVSGKTLVVGAAGTDGETRRRRQLLADPSINYFNWIPGTAYVYRLKV